MINDDKTMYEDLRSECNNLKDSGGLPDWYNTNAYQMYKEKYMYQGETLNQAFKRMAKAAASYLPEELKGLYEIKFFDIMWKGWLVPASPVYNLGTNRGMAVSCSGGYVGDSVYDFYENQLETAMLSKNGFGTSAYLGDIRPRGSDISVGGKSDGLLKVLQGLVNTANHISQGSNRRGAVASYIPIEHGDFYEIVKYLEHNPDGLNIGWNISNEFIERLKQGDEDATERMQEALHVKLITGKGYFSKVDVANELAPDCIKRYGVPIKGSNLCNEIFLPQNEEMTFSCVLSSMNASKFLEWEGTDAVRTATVFLDCVVEDLIQRGSKVKGLDKVVRFTERFRALGLGCLGYSTLLQSQSIPIESLEARFMNQRIFKFISEEATAASEWLGEELGCSDVGKLEDKPRRNSNLMAIAPNFSSSILAGGISQSIEPFYKNVFLQGGASGELNRINPELLKVLKSYEMYNDKVINQIIDDFGSVRNLDFLTDHEKDVFKTAFEINQSTLITLAAQRQRYVDQGQSLNLFFSADEDEEVVARVHAEALFNPNIKGLYYLRSESGVQASKGECVACEG